MPRILSRLVEPRIGEALATAQVVVLQGGRAVGKTTVCDVLIERNGWPPRLDLGDPDVLATLRLSPERFLSAEDTPCVIDEAQLEPALTTWVKRLVDTRRGPGQFLLTGSARLGRDQLGGSDPLAGRSVRLQMWSLTQHELAARPSDFLTRAFGDGWSRSGSAVGTLSDRARWLGGLPTIAGVLTDASPSEWERAIASYVEAVIPIGVASSRADTGRLLRTFRYFAANSGQLVNYSRAASELGMQANTVRSHLEILEACFLLVRCEAHRSMEHRVVTAHPRVFATDAGLAAWAARAWAAPTAAALGAVTETMVAHDIMAQADAHVERVVVRHWRDNRNAR